MPFVPLVPKGSAPPLAPYSPGTAAGGAIYVSGTLALDKEGRLVGKDDVRVQARHVLKSIESVLKAGGAGMSDIAYNMIFIKRASDYAAVNEVYKEFFLVEISSIAHKR